MGRLRGGGWFERRLSGVFCRRYETPSSLEVTTSGEGVFVRTTLRCERISAIALYNSSLASGSIFHVRAS